MYIETPITEWSTVAAILLCATITIPLLTVVAVKALIAAQNKLKK